MWMYSNNLICDILLYIDENITDKITVEELENKFFYNRYYIMKLFKKEMNITLINYMNSLRIYKAIILIKETDNNLLNIANIPQLKFVPYLTYHLNNYLL